jgi:hypothetical protein
MPRRIEIELTSRTPDGGWTWRAAGARQPRGSVNSELVPAGTSVGDVLRAEVESGIDGIEVVALSPPPAREEQHPERRIEVVGAFRRGPDISVTLAPGSRRGREEGRPGRRDGPRREGAGRRGAAAATDDRSRLRAGEEPPGRPAPAARGARNEGDGRPRRSGPMPRRERRPAVSTTHRNALLATLPPEQLPVAEQLLRGGLPAVREAIDEQAAKARATGGPPVSSDALLAMAERLLPAVNLANWKDRASAAQAAGKELRLRDLRAVVTASRTVTLDEEGRVLARALQESLDHRVRALREEWVARITSALDGDRVLDAVRASARPPEPATRLPAELAVRVAAAAGAAMSAEREPAAWLELLDAVVESPVRRNVKPAGIPPAAEVQAAARAAAGLVPELAKLLGLRIPPPPPRRPVARRVVVSPVSGGGPTSAP